MSKTVVAPARPMPRSSARPAPDVVVESAFYADDDDTWERAPLRRLAAQ
jgi:hypothetical protein